MSAAILQDTQYTLREFLCFPLAFKAYLGLLLPKCFPLCLLARCQKASLNISNLHHVTIPSFLGYIMVKIFGGHPSRRWVYTPSTKGNIQVFGRIISSFFVLILYYHISPYCQVLTLVFEKSLKFKNQHS